MVSAKCASVANDIKFAKVLVQTLKEKGKIIDIEMLES